jgi:hypothetical protein
VHGKTIFKTQILQRQKFTSAFFLTLSYEIHGSLHPFFWRLVQLVTVDTTSMQCYLQAVKVTIDIFVDYIKSVNKMATSCFQTPSLATSPKRRVEYLNFVSLKVGKTPKRVDIKDIPAQIRLLRIDFA